MKQSKFIKEDIYVIFTRSQFRHWFSRWTNPEFAHCFIVKKEFGVWILVDTKNSFLYVTTKLVDDFPYIKDLCPDTKILAITSKIDPNKTQWHPGIGSCVDVCKGVLGIRKFFCFTPFQLYKYIKGII